MALNCQAESAAARPCGVCPSCRRIANDADPDLILAEADESGRLRIEPLREVMRLLSLKPYAARYRIAILNDFDRVMPRAQDALLKTLEEPPAHAVLIVLSRKLEPVLPTIRSRAQIIPFRPPASGTNRVGFDRARRDARTSPARRRAQRRSRRLGDLPACADSSLLHERSKALDLLLEVSGSQPLQRMKIVRRTQPKKPARTRTRYAPRSKSGRHSGAMCCCKLAAPRCSPTTATAWMTYARCPGASTKALR